MSLVFTSACRQKKRCVKFHVKFAEIQPEFYKYYSFAICDQACKNRPCEHKKIADF